MSAAFEIELPCSTIVAGRPIPLKIQLIELHQSLVYSGLLEGLPTDRLNQRLIAGAVQDARNSFRGVEPFLIPPTQVPFDIGQEYPFGKPATLPAVRCIAFFRSIFLTPRGQKGDYSAMTLVWFQSHFAMPIDPAVIEQIRTLDWLGLATNLEA